MMRAKKFAVYVVSAVALALFAPVLPFHYLAGGGVILVGLFLIDLVQSSRRR